MRVYAVVLSVFVVLLGVAAVGPSAARAGVSDAGHSASASVISVTSATSVTTATTAAVAVAAQQSDGETTSDPGPQLDPQTEADAEKDRSRLIVGVVAAVLLGIVLWGRWARSKKKS